MNSPNTQVGARVWAFLPLAFFVLLAGLFAWAVLGQRVDRHASALIGKPAPDFVLPDLDGKTVRLSAYRGKPVILNVFASWCAPCRIEHPQLMQMANDSRFTVLGLAYRDDPAKLAAYFDELGVPFAQTGLDRQGDVGIQLGLAGVPETYVISPTGTVVWRHQGEVTAKVAGELVRIAVQSK